MNKNGRQTAEYVPAATSEHLVALFCWKLIVVEDALGVNPDNVVDDEFDASQPNTCKKDGECARACVYV